MTDREAIAKIAEAIQGMLYLYCCEGITTPRDSRPKSVRHHGDAQRTVKELAAIVEEFGTPTKKADSDYQPGGQWGGGPGMPYGS
jgi:tryptophan synthase alpha subunit